MLMRIVADSSCDLYALDHDFITVPLTIYTDERSFLDDESLDIKEMLDYLQSYKGRSYTSCPSIDSWLKAYDGAKEIFVFTVTSALSGSCGTALSAAKTYREKDPEAKIVVIDSLSTGAEIALAIHKLMELEKAGYSFEEMEERIKDHLRRSRLFFAFVSLHNIAQNGRINKALASALNVFNIVITGTASPEGTISVTGKARGQKNSLQVLIRNMKEAGYQGGKAVITHVENETGALQLKEMILKEFPDANILTYPARGLCSYYMERKGIVISCQI